MVTNNGDLPRDIVIEVLSRLPVKSLIRFRCVSKTWSDLISTPCFIFKHLKHDDNTRLFVTYMIVDKTDEYGYPIFLYHMFPDETLTDRSLQDLQLPQSQCGIVGGPYDGIFCMQGIDNHLTLWNLATNETRNLPKFRALPQNTSKFCTNFGFGLDTMSNDYKFVMILTLWDKKRNSLYEFSHVAVYNLRTSCWKDSECFKSNHYYIEDSTDSAYLDGVCYWLSKFRNNFGCKVILSFHMGDEIFQEIEGPSNHIESEHDTFGLYNYSLSLLLLDKSNNFFVIWSMKEKCWTKVVTVGPLIGVDKPLGFWKKGAFLLHSNTEQLLLYDPSTNEMRDLGLESSYFSVRTYKESLIPIKGDDSLFEFFEIPWHILNVH